MAKMELKRVGVLSLAKIMGIVYAGLALVIGVPVLLLMMVLGAAVSSMSGDNSGAGVGIAGGLFMMVLFPVFYGIVGFIFGAIFGLVYNIAAGFVGGLEFEFEQMAAEYAAPPPPQWGVGQNQPGQQQYPY